MKNAVGILGGTFNPVHNGHIAVAEAAVREFDLQKVIFLPHRLKATTAVLFHISVNTA